MGTAEQIAFEMGPTGHAYVTADGTIQMRENENTPWHSLGSTTLSPETVKILARIGRRYSLSNTQEREQIREQISQHMAPAR